MRDDKSFFFFLQNLAYVYIASLQFYKQMYNKYIINKLLMWDSEEPAFVCSFFFFFHLFLLWQYGGSASRGFSSSTRSTRTPLRCGGRNPSSPSSPCLLSGGWRSVRCLCCSPWSFCARSLWRGSGEAMEGVGGGEQSRRKVRYEFYMSAQVIY